MELGRQTSGEAFRGSLALWGGKARAGEAERERPVSVDGMWETRAIAGSLGRDWQGHVRLDSVPPFLQGCREGVSLQLALNEIEVAPCVPLPQMIIP